ncbi:hypothetical protein CTAYLR_006633 [Chrysophaeum taylorii]|uniref:WWE domain-containing protein n=1 Tax=Chrysophaeum taylorii TaxID=2483200 RepID=A0AAD7UK43_9STRA|nr:hypothetical protein CTAYLR_006633 [Chrysophaeum taylorii]
MAFWEFQISKGKWKGYAQNVSQALETAREHQRTFKFSCDGRKYEVDFAAMTQKRLSSGTRRPVRRSIAPVADPGVSIPFGVEASVGLRCVKKIEIRDLGPAASPLADEFNRAWAQYNRMYISSSSSRRHHARRILQIDAYDSATTHLAFASKRSDFVHAGKPVDEVWCFHGTIKDETIESIMCDGFKVGGVDVPRANGRTPPEAPNDKWHTLYHD